jgi:hypothetical protein
MTYDEIENILIQRIVPDSILIDIYHYIHDPLLITIEQQTNLLLFLAGRQSLPLYILERLALYNNSSSIHKCVLYDLNCTPEICEILFRKNNFKLKELIVEHSKCPEKLQIEFALEN